MIRTLAALLDETGLGEIEYEIGDIKIRVARPLAATVAVPQPAPATSAPAVTPALTEVDRGEAVPSPMVGTVYLAAEPSAPPFVQPGTVVKKNDTLMIIEAMKTMNPIAAPRSGTVKSVAVDNGQPVEYGQTLVVLE
ncbi:MAG: biotin/lipoyl-binding protein [Alphaproteobacteria bacterium]|nr:biotin/lipoyl-binding protein [Alphaproteobacteria bacterium]